MEQRESQFRVPVKPVGTTRFQVEVLEEVVALKLEYMASVPPLRVIGPLPKALVFAVSLASWMVPALRVVPPL